MPVVSGLEIGSLGTTSFLSHLNTCCHFTHTLPDVEEPDGLTADFFRRSGLTSRTLPLVYRDRSR
jgi:hypothetical protein